jgi:hypothetical protein
MIPARVFPNYTQLASTGNILLLILQSLKAVNELTPRTKDGYRLELM